MNQFKVGDRVRCVRGCDNSRHPGSEWGTLVEGATYVVEDCCSTYAAFPVKIEGVAGRWYENRFEKIEDAPAMVAFDDDAPDQEANAIAVAVGLLEQMEIEAAQRVVAYLSTRYEY